MLDQELVRRAELGEYEAVMELGDIFFYGRDVEVDDNKAFEYFSKGLAIYPDEAQVLLRMGQCYFNGYGVSCDKEKGLSYLQQAADKGLKKGHYHFARAMRLSEGVREFIDKIVFHYSKAAELCDEDAMVELGDIFRDGDYVPQNYEEAIKYYEMAANCGSSDALFRLAQCYYNGWGVQKNIPRSSQLWEQSAEKGHWGSQFYTGLNYEIGEGVEKDLDKALHWYGLAAEQKHERACLKLGELLVNRGEIAKGLEYIEQSVDLGCEDAMFRLGVIYYEGEIVPEDKPKAVSLWKKGSDLGMAACSKNLGICYKQGAGVPQDNALAIQWYEKAESQGSIDAMMALGAAYDDDGIAPLSYEKAVYYYRKAMECGDASGAYCLATMYRKGHGVEEDQKKAFECFNTAANLGSPEGVFRVATLYYEGIGVEKNISKAIEYAEKAKELGNIFADGFLSKIYAESEQNGLDPSSAFDYLLKRAEAGDAEAQYQVYDSYYNGRGVEENYEVANMWCRRAADNGHVIAQALTGLNEYLFGDTKLAVQYWEKAAEAGHLNAMNSLGELYLEGDSDITVDKAKAVSWFHKAAEGGYADAQLNLGVCYAVGKGVEADDYEAFKWFKLAAEQGQVYAQKNLAISYRDGDGTAVNKALAAEWFEKAAEQGNHQAQKCLADMYAEGEGIPSNYSKAENLYQAVIDSKDETYYYSAVFGLAYLYSTKTNQKYKAFPLWIECAESGNDAAEFNVGLFYHNGWGVSKDYDMAIQWYERAAAHGHSDARDNIELIRKERAMEQYRESTQRDNSSSSGSSGCYVATAVYGSYDCPEVWTLRRFRDYSLASTWYGRAFIKVYYAISPSLVKWFGNSPWFINLCKPKLDRLIDKLHRDGVSDTPYYDR